MTQNDTHNAAALPEGWLWATVGEMIAPDGVFSDGDWVESKDQDPSGDVRLIQLADIGDGVYRDRSNRFLTTSKAQDLGCTFLEPGDVLIARMPDPLGRACIFPGDARRCVTAVDVCIVRTGKHGVVHRWLMHSINSPQSRRAIASYQSGSTRKRISRGNLAKIEYPVPPLPEQYRIVEAVETQLTRVDAAVAALGRAQATLERYRASVLQAACEGRLVSTEAELARREHREYEPADELLARMLEERRARWEEERWEHEIERAKKKAAQAERKAASLPHYMRDLDPKDWEHRTPEEYEPYLPKSDRWKEKYDEPEPPDTEELPNLPEGWRPISLGQALILSQNGFGRRRSERGRPTVVLRLADIEEGQRISLDDVRRIRMTDEEVDRYRLLEDDLLCIRVNGSPDLVGRVIPFEGSDEPIAFCDHFIRLRLAVPELTSFFVRYSDTRPARRYVDLNKVSSAGQNTVSQTTMESLVFPLPPLGEQQRIVEEVERRLSMVEALEKSVEANLTRAERLRQAILKKAFEGRLVDQDPNDESAAVLLKRILEEHL